MLFQFEMVFYIGNYTVELTISSSIKQILNIAQFINKIFINNQIFSMSKAKAPKRVTVEASEESQESDLPELAANTKPSKKQVVQQKKNGKKVAQPEQSDEEDTPVVQNKKAANKGRKASVEEQSSVSKDKVKKIVKTSVEPARKASLDKKKGKAVIKAESSQESEQQQKPKVAAKNNKKVNVVAQPPKKNNKMVAESDEESQQDQIIEQPKLKGSSPKVQPIKSPITKPKASPKIQAKNTKKPVASQQQQSESEQQKPVVKKGKILNQKPVATKKAKDSEQEESSEQEKPKAKVAIKAGKQINKAAKKPVKQSSSEQEQEVKPKRKVSKDVVAKKPVKKVQQVKESSGDEEEVQPKRKASKDSLKVKGGKVANDEQGEFEVCVQQLSYQAFQNDLKEHFEPCGQIISIRVLTRPDGKSKGTGFVKFAWKSAYNKALELDGSDLMGRPIKVSEAQNKTFDGNNKGGFNDRNGGGFNDRNGGGFNKAPRQNQNFESNSTIENPTLFIGGLSYNSTVQSIKDHFQGCGSVTSARIVTDKETGKPRGFGYVQFSDLGQAQAAYKSMNGSMLDGRQIRLDASTPRDRPQGGGFNRGGDRNGGGFNRGGGSFNKGNSQVDLSQEDRNLKSGAIGTFTGKKVML